jgi:hypothetical protein
MIGILLKDVKQGKLSLVQGDEIVAMPAESEGGWADHYYVSPADGSWGENGLLVHVSDFVVMEGFLEDIDDEDTVEVEVDQYYNRFAA